MSSEIAIGDLVMVVRPQHCCGDSRDIGKTGIVGPSPRSATSATCDFCGSDDPNVGEYFDVAGEAFHYSILKKLDPPAEGDSLPTRKDIEVRA